MNTLPDDVAAIMSVLRDWAEGGDASLPMRPRPVNQPENDDATNTPAELDLSWDQKHRLSQWLNTASPAISTVSPFIKPPV